MSLNSTCIAAVFDVCSDQQTDPNKGQTARLHWVQPDKGGHCRTRPEVWSGHVTHRRSGAGRPLLSGKKQVLEGRQLSFCLIHTCVFLRYLECIILNIMTARYFKHIILSLYNIPLYRFFNKLALIWISMFFIVPIFIHIYARHLANECTILVEATFCIIAE